MLYMLDSQFQAFPEEEPNSFIALFHAPNEGRSTTSLLSHGLDFGLHCS